jgi:hypothetical protein
MKLSLDALRVLDTIAAGDPSPRRGLAAPRPVSDHLLPSRPGREGKVLKRFMKRLADPRVAAELPA